MDTIAVPGVVKVEVLGITPTGLVLPPHLTFEQWMEVGRRLRVVRTAGQWAVGDFLVYGEQYGEQYVAGAEDALDLKTHEVKNVLNLMWVSKAIPPERRRLQLGWSHHAEVAALPAEQADAFLDRAVDEHMSVKELREATRQARRAVNGRAAEVPLMERRCANCHCTLREIAERLAAMEDEA